MGIYKIINKKLKYVEETNFKLEKEIQRMCEDNLEELFGLKVVKSEFVIQNFRIDTLAFNPKIKSFVVLEYKKDKNFSVIDQGYAYLSLILNNKADFVLAYNESTDEILKKDDIDWSQTKVIFVSPLFTVYQKQSISFKDLPIELWEMKKYKNNIVSINQIESLGANATINTLSGKNKKIDSVSKGIKVYTEGEHLSVAKDNILELYEKLKITILSLGNNIKIKPTKKYIGFISRTNFVDVCVQKKSLKIWLNLKKGELDDTKRLAIDVSQKGHWGNGDYEIQIDNDENLDYLMGLIKQLFMKSS
ncbi:MAG: DUF5655 domain-containing protein [Endomicrobiia bacterium]